MTSWRDIVPPVVLEDLDRLYSAALGAAVESIEKQGVLFPRALTLDVSGQLGFHVAEPEPSGHLTAIDAITVLDRSLFSIRDDLRATAFLMDITWTDSDAVRVDLEHRDGGPAVIIRTPYRIRKRLRRRTITLGPAHESDDERRMWP